MVLAGVVAPNPVIPVPRTEIEGFTLLTRFGLNVSGTGELRELLLGRPVRAFVENAVGISGATFRPPVQIAVGDRIVVRTFPLSADVFTGAPVGVVMVHEPTGHGCLLQFADGLFHDPPSDF